MAKQVLLNSLSRNLGCEVSTAKYLLEKVEESLRDHLLRGHSYTMRGICTLKPVKKELNKRLRNPIRVKVTTSRVLLEELNRRYAGRN